MNYTDLKPARSFALNFGCKAVIYGKPGSGKTPVTIMTAPNPVVLMCEPGFLSVRNSDIPTWPAFSADKIDEFFRWVKTSDERKRFQTIIVDSISQMAEIIIDKEMGGTTAGGNQAHGLKAYGNMARTVMDYMNTLYFLPQCHVALIAKLQTTEVMGATYLRPYLPGRELNVRIPHLFDLILQLGDYNIPGVVPSPTKAFRTKESFDSMARDRSGNLAEFEPPNLAHIFKKCMSS